MAVECSYASPVIKNSTIKKNTDGITYDAYSAPVIAKNTFTENDDDLIIIYATQIDSNIYGNTYTNNTKNYIEVRAGGSYRLGTADKVYDWLKDGAPYVLDDNLIVYEDGPTTKPPILNIQSGVTLKFPKDK